MNQDSPIRTVVEQNADAGRSLMPVDAPWIAIALGVTCLTIGCYLGVRAWRRRGLGSDAGEGAFRTLAAHLGLDADSQRAIRALAAGLDCLPAALLVCPRAMEEAGRRAIRRGERITPGQVDRLVSAARVARR